jgi:hypothetical protein
MLRIRTSPLFTAVLAVVLLAACATAPPVQEMSDARQAIAAAVEAGAGDLAPNELIKAEALLEGAEDYLEVGTSSAYWQARKAAVRSKEVAFEALLVSRNAKDAATGRSP